jgi:hypothetical protein
MTIPNVTMGTEVTIIGTFRRKDLGTLYDPSTVTLYLTDPWGAVVVYSSDDDDFDNTNTGVFSVDRVLDKSGDWKYRFVGSGDLTATSSGVIAVSAVA